MSRLTHGVNHKIGTWTFMTARILQIVRRYLQFPYRRSSSSYMTEQVWHESWFRSMFDKALPYQALTSYFFVTLNERSRSLSFKRFLVVLNKVPQKSVLELAAVFSFVGSYFMYDVNFCWWPVFYASHLINIAGKVTQKVTIRNVCRLYQHFVFG